MHIYRGNWVVDHLGDYCKVTCIDDSNDDRNTALVWGYWSNTPEFEFQTDISKIVGKYRTRKEAKIIADIIKQREED